MILGYWSICTRSKLKDEFFSLFKSECLTRNGRNIGSSRTLGKVVHFLLKQIHDIFNKRSPLVILPSSGEFPSTFGTKPNLAFPVTKVTWEDPPVAWTRDHNPMASFLRTRLHMKHPDNKPTLD